MSTTCTHYEEKRALVEKVNNLKRENDRLNVELKAALRFLNDSVNVRIDDARSPAVKVLIKHFSNILKHDEPATPTAETSDSQPRLPVSAARI